MKLKLGLFICLVYFQLLLTESKSIPISFLSKAPSGNLDLTGTLNLPDTPTSTKPPAVVLIAGSGVGEQSETIFYQLPNFMLSPPPSLTSCGFTGVLVAVFDQLAEGLAAHGIAVLRYNKRSCVKDSKVPGCNYTLCPINDTTPPLDCLNLHKLTPTDLAIDASNAVVFLRETYGEVIDAGRVSVLGHSEGSSVAPYAASMAEGVKTVVQLMGVGVSLLTVIEEQARTNARLYQYGSQVCLKIGGDPIVTSQMLQAAFASQSLAAQCAATFPLILNGSIPDESLVYVGGAASAGYWRVGVHWADVTEQFRILSSIAPTTAILTINSPTDTQVWPQFYQPLHAITLALPNTRSLVFPNLTHVLLPADLTSSNISQPLIQNIADFILNH